MDGRETEEYIKIYGLNRVPVYSEYRTRRDIRILEYLQTKGVGYTTTQSKYINRGKNKTGRLKKHMGYKKGKIRIEPEVYQMLSEYAEGATLQQIADKYKKNKSMAGYNFEIIDPEYANKYKRTTLNVSRDVTEVKNVKNMLLEGYTQKEIKEKLKLPNENIVKEVRERITKKEKEGIEKEKEKEKERK